MSHPRTGDEIRPGYGGRNLSPVRGTKFDRGQRLTGAGNRPLYGGRIAIPTPVGFRPPILYYPLYPLIAMLAHRVPIGQTENTHTTAMVQSTARSLRIGV